MKSGYPRFFIPLVVGRLTTRLLAICEPSAAKEPPAGGQEHTKAPLRNALVFTSLRYASLCRRTMDRWNPQRQPGSHADIRIYAVGWDGNTTAVAVQDEELAASPRRTSKEKEVGQEDVFLVSYPAELEAHAKAFWQHTGFGISSRQATYWFERAPFLAEKGTAPPPGPSAAERRLLADQARDALRRRLAAGHSSPAEGFHVSEDDVFLFQAGMAAIAETAEAAKALHPSGPHRVAVLGCVPSDPSDHSSRPVTPV